MSKDLVFISNDHIIYENGNNISGHCYGEWRQLRIHKVIGQVYRFSISKLRPGSLRDIGKSMPPASVLLEDQATGYLRFTAADKELLVSMEDNKVKEVRWYDAGRATVFIKAPGKKLQKAINIPLDLHLTGVQNKDTGGLIECYQSIQIAMEANADATVETATYYLLLGQSFLQRGAYREAKEAFTQCCMLLLLNGHTPWHEAIFLYGRVSEVEGNLREAKQFYHLAMERYNERAGAVTKEQIQEALNGLRDR